VAGAFRRFGVSRMIHGHTHRPATHRIEVDGAPRERIVLPDWHETARYVRVDEEGVDVVDLRESGMGNGE
jgi:UDP-2,3-diacylglucosamine hydrolase